MDVWAPIKIVSSHLTCFLCLSDTGGGLCPSEQKQLQPASRASVGVLESNWWKSYLKLFFVFRDFTFMMYHQHFDCKISNQISIVAVIQPIHTISTRCKNSPSWSNSLKIDSCNLQLNLAKSWDQTRLFWVGVINVINCQPIKQHCHRGVVASPGAGLTLLTTLMWGSGECCKISACLPSVSWHYITLYSLQGDIIPWEPCDPGQLTLQQCPHYSGSLQLLPWPLMLHNSVMRRCVVCSVDCGAQLDAAQTSSFWLLYP